MSDERTETTEPEKFAWPEVELAPNEHLIQHPALKLQLIAKLNTDTEELLGNVKSALARKLPEIWPHAPQDTELGICAGGPSLNGSYDAMRDLVESGGQLVGLANATHKLLEHGIRPSAQVILDAKPRNAEFVHDIEGCTYFIASQANPAVFDKVAGFTAGNQRTFVWHAMNNQKEMQAVLDGLDRPWVPVQGGSTITLRALRMFQILGYHRFHMFGFDSCYLHGEHHAYEQTAGDHFKTATIVCNDREYQCTGWMMNQAMEFLKWVKLFGQELHMVVHGDGLIAEMIRTAPKSAEAA